MENYIVTTFYSLKGGCGRSLALANASYELAKRGRNVMAVDLDLEAPGLIDIFGLNKEDVRNGSVVDVFTKEMDELGDYLLSDDSPIVSLKEKYKDTNIKGKLFLLPAKREIGKRDLAEEVVHSLRYMDDRRIEIIKKLVRIFGLDYLLIDSRSGISEEAISSLLLANSRVVLSVRFDRQSRAGVAYTYNVLKKTFADKGIKVVLLASNIPTDIDKEIKKIKSEVESAVNDKIRLMIPHDSRLVINEELVVKTRPRSEIAKSFRKLADLLEEEE